MRWKQMSDVNAVLWLVVSRWRQMSSGQATDDVGQYQQLGLQLTKTDAVNWTRFLWRLHDHITERNAAIDWLQKSAANMQV